MLALAFGLVEGGTKTRVARTLARMVEDNGTALTTGFVGTPYLCHVLTENGYNDLAYRLVMRKEYPSWLYSIGKGATTIWEHWDSIKEDGTFWSEDMNSFNHYAYGSVGEWLYRVVAGIDTSEAEPGYKGIVIHPRPGGGITSAEAAYASMYGTIRSSWSIEGGRMRLDVTIPPNTTATIVLLDRRSGQREGIGYRRSRRRRNTLGGKSCGGVEAAGGLGAISVRVCRLEGAFRGWAERTMPVSRAPEAGAYARSIETAQALMPAASKLP